MSAPFRFLNLPTEIRLRIMEFALTDGTRASTVKLIGGRRSRITGTYLDAIPSYSSSPKPSAQILLTDRQINAEGTPILYSKNTFSICSSNLDRFIKAVGTANRQHISSIHIDGTTMELYFTSKCFESLEECIGLKRFRLNALSSVLCLAQCLYWPDITQPGMFVLLAPIPVIKMLCEREGSKEAARRIIEVLPCERCNSHESYVWSAVPCIRCCEDSWLLEVHRITEDEFWSDVPKRDTEAKEWAKREEEMIEELQERKRMALMRKIRYVQAWSAS